MCPLLLVCPLSRPPWDINHHSFLQRKGRWLSLQSDISSADLNIPPTNPVPSITCLNRINDWLTIKESKPQNTIPVRMYGSLPKISIWKEPAKNWPSGSSVHLRFSLSSALFLSMSFSQTVCRFVLLFTSHYSSPKTPTSSAECKLNHSKQHSRKLLLHVRICKSNAVFLPEAADPAQHPHFINCTFPFLYFPVVLVWFCMWVKQYPKTMTWSTTLFHLKLYFRIIV